MQSHPKIIAPSSDWSENQTLYVAACYSNPFRWKNRRNLAYDFIRHMRQSANVELHFIELAYGDRPFEVTGPHNSGIHEIQVRTNHELFHKENLLNIAIRSFPNMWKYGAVIDADFLFTRHDWALEAIHQLQHHHFVQLFSSYTNLSGNEQGVGHRPLDMSHSFAYNYRMRGDQLPIDYRPSGKKLPYQDQKGGAGGVTATGGAWAFTRYAMDTIGEMLERCILGSADWFMAFGLVSDPEEKDIDYRDRGLYTSGYWNYIRAWQNRASQLTKNIGYIDCHAVHHWHGSKTRRGYGKREELLIRHNFDPYEDVYPDSQGVLQLTPKKPRLRDEIRRYFLSRSEDSAHSHFGD